MANPAEVAEIYIAAWNETDAKARHNIIADTWTADAVYVDPLAAVEGHEGLTALIGGVQERFPGFRFALIGEPDGHGEHVRFSWGLGPDGQEPPIKGTDYVRVEDGRLKSVTGFLDLVPG